MHTTPYHTRPQDPIYIPARIRPPSYEWTLWLVVPVFWSGIVWLAVHLL